MNQISNATFTRGSRSHRVVIEAIGASDVHAFQTNKDNLGGVTQLADIEYLGPFETLDDLPGHRWAARTYDQWNNTAAIPVQSVVVVTVGPGEDKKKHLSVTVDRNLIIRVAHDGSRLVGQPSMGYVPITSPRDSDLRDGLPVVDLTTASPPKWKIWTERITAGIFVAIGTTLAVNYLRQLAHAGQRVLESKWPPIK